MSLNGWKINLQVCYDLRFPVWSKNSYENGTHAYDVLIYAANWPEVRSHAYKSLLLARAIENQAYVIWVNRVGEDGNKIKHSGDTMIVDPYGKIIQQAKPFKEESLFVTLSYSKLTDFRSKFKVGLDWDNYSISYL
ncbi:MAG: nitrilase-related carbon-nitrogen hydrolase [Bacteroidales bacterium]